MKPHSLRILGAMSGTSSDGVDVVALEVTDSPLGLSYQGLVSIDFPDTFRQVLLNLQDPQHVYPEGHDPFATLAVARRDLSARYADAVLQLLKQLDWDASTVAALGAHGQTIRHNPEAGYSFQILDPALVKQLTGIRVISDFRSADVALGGQGAPLVPTFHQAWLTSAKAFDEVGLACVLNLGGFSNLTVFGPNGEITQGGDCGPANLFLDWCAQQHLDARYDAGGKWASSGQVDSRLLAELMSHPYFQSAWPASTGREHFNVSWLLSVLRGHPAVAPEDLMATLVEMSAKAVVRCISSSQGRLFVCGGGVNNLALMNRLTHHLGDGWKVQSTDALGLPPQAVEAAAFAWLAYCYQADRPGNCPAVTGACGAGVLGVATA